MKVIIQSSILQSTENLVLVGQYLNDDKVYVYGGLPLSEKYNEFLDDLSQKNKLSDFCNQVQDITTSISMGLKPVGLLLKEKQLYFNNLKVLKTICQTFCVKQMLFGSTDQIEMFDLENLKTTKTQVQTDHNINLVKFTCLMYMQTSADELQTYMQQIRKSFDKSKLYIEGQVVQDKDILNDFLGESNDVQVQLFKPQTQSIEDIENETEGEKIQGNIYLTVYSNKNASVKNLKDLFYNDLEDQMSLRFQNNQEEKTFLQRILFQINGQIFDLQEFDEYGQDNNIVEEHIKRKLEQNLSNSKILMIQRQDSKPKSQVRKTQPQNIDLLPNSKQQSEQMEDPLVNPETSKGSFQMKLNQLYFLGLVVLLISVGIGLRQML